MRIAVPAAAVAVVVSLACGGGGAPQAEQVVVEPAPVVEPVVEAPAPIAPVKLVEASWAEEIPVYEASPEEEPLVCGEITLDEEFLGDAHEQPRVYRWAGAHYLSIEGQPSRRCGEVSGPATRIEVWPAGGTPYGWDVAAAGARRALGDDWGFVVLGPDASNERTGVEVLHVGGAADLAKRIGSELGDAGVAVKVREWKEAPSPVVIAVGTGVGPSGVPAVSRLTLHGNTPVLAWSPSGNRLLTNSAYNDVYGSYDGGIERTRGAWVIEAQTGSARRLTDARVWHPMWAGDQVVYIVPGEGLRVGHWTGTQEPHEGLASNDDWGGYLWPNGLAPGHGETVTMYLDYGVPETGWYRFDPADGSRVLLESDVDTGFASPAWDPPQAHVDTQCHDSVGEAKIVRDNDRFSVVVAAGEVGIPGTPLHRYRHDEYGWFCEERPQMCVPIAPCLSPDGAYVAWLSRGPRPDQYDVNVMPLK